MKTPPVPEWVGIGTGMFGTKRVLVPVGGAQVMEDGLLVAYDKGHVKDSPDVDDEEISAEASRSCGRTTGCRTARGRRRRAVARPTDQAITRSEEEFEVGKRSQQAGTARLRKWVETEPVALDVELRREVARVTREPIDQPVGDHEFSEQEIEVPLHEEKPVVQKRAIAKERVSVEKNVQSQTQRVEDELRKERVDVEGDVDR